ncbi:hypothetical protein F5B22DRAFT_647740 [Xylaria bambusicola]|uniref:uncharacterized protein n=1 Tax=Xylaria bambusicola TaxID=326684 RepID=UPI00200839A1|nr:uncharacterized protein F5B22DRAFT_647740 [Xylaria bambusicola]KAI0514428.1 hypothetical protein F5B22DRAFT_647740 [Xylaria bambusicola]
MSANDNAKLNSAGGPIFRHPDLSHEEFAAAWHRHGRLAVPWALKFGVWEYIQIHMPNPGSLSTGVTDDDGTVEARARRILLQADGMAIMRRYDVPTEAGHLYFSNVILKDERTFLHDESGAGAVKGDPPVYDVPELHVDVWREMALEMGGVEHVKIKDGKDLAGNAMWEEWERVEKERKEMSG